MAKSEGLDSMRTQLTALEHKTEQHRQAAERQRRRELDNLAAAGGHHRIQADGALTARAQILKEMTGVRNKMQDKLLTARATATASVATADRELARAGKLALDQKLEADRWQARAAEEESRLRNVARREEDNLNRLRKATGDRVAASEACSADRVVRAQGFVEETAATFDQIRQRHAEHAAAQAAHAQRATALHVAGCQTARMQCAYEVNKAVPKLQREKLAQIENMQKAREDAHGKVTAAHLDLQINARECQDHKETQLVCAAQGRKIAATLCEQTEVDRHEALQQLQAKLEFTTSQAQRKVANFNEEKTIADRRNQAWDRTAAQEIAIAQARSEAESAKAVARVQDAKVMLANLQASCAAYIRNVMEQWEEAKADNAAKVQAAQERTDVLRSYCDRSLQQCQRQWADKLVETDRIVDEKQRRLEEKVSKHDELSRRRVEMTHGQAKGWRDQAEKHLAEFKGTAETVRLRQIERVKQEEEVCAEKVRLARARYEQRAELAARRTREAEARRGKALADYTAVMARIAGAAQEARRRGLDNIADIIEPPHRAQQMQQMGLPDLPEGMPEEPEDMAEEPYADADAESAGPDLPEDMPSGPDVEAAALRIQAIQRGKTSRKATEEKRETTQANCESKLLVGDDLMATSSTLAPPSTAGSVNAAGR